MEQCSIFCYDGHSDENLSAGAGALPRPRGCVRASRPLGSLPSNPKKLVQG